MRDVHERGKQSRSVRERGKYGERGVCVLRCEMQCVAKMCGTKYMERGVCHLREGTVWQCVREERECGSERQKRGVCEGKWRCKSRESVQRRGEDASTVLCVHERECYVNHSQ